MRKGLEIRNRIRPIVTSPMPASQTPFQFHAPQAQAPSHEPAAPPMKKETNAELVCHLGQEWLAVIEVGNRDAASRGHDPDRAGGRHFPARAVGIKRAVCVCVRMVRVLGQFKMEAPILLADGLAGTTLLLQPEN